jgi:hypothetical protein
MTFTPPACLDIKIGLHQRLAPSLLQDFYPEGLPEDWRANYLVLLTQAIWVCEDDPDLACVLEAIATAPKPVRMVWAGFGDSAVLQNWQHAHPDLSVLVLPPDALIWSPDSAALGARVGLILACAEPLRLRAWLTAFAVQAPHEACALFVTGDTPSVATLNKAQTLLELLGW